MALPRTCSKGQRGFALIMVMLLVGLLGVLSVTYLNHVALSHEDSRLSRLNTDAAGAVDSAVHWGRQALRTNGQLGSATLTNQGRSATVQVSDLANDHGSILSQSLDSNGLGATSVVEVSRLPVPLTDGAASLPTLPAVTLQGLLTNVAVPKTYYGGVQTVQDTDLTGVVVLEDGADITFSNVTLTGLLTTDRVLHGTPFDEYDADEAPTAIVQGLLRIDGGSFLPGVAVLLNDGRFISSGSDASVQITGDVLAHTIEVSGVGAIAGNIAAVTPASLGSQLEQPNAGRTPQPWSSSLQMGESYDLEYVAWLPRIDTLADVSAITNFEWP